MPSIALIGTSLWIEQAGMRLRQQGFETVAYSDTGITLRERLVNDYPALVLIDGGAPDWKLQTATIKSDQATRRIPVLVIAGAAQEQQALSAGADGFLTEDVIAARLIDTVRRLARLPKPEAIETLACQCDEELPPLARRAVDLFGTGAYYEQHDLFEKQWMAEPGPVRELYRAVLQVGIAYYHITRGNHAGALRMLRRSVQWFALLPDTCQGIDVRQLREDAARVRVALEALSPDAIDLFDRALLKPIPMIRKSGIR